MLVFVLVIRESRGRKRPKEEIGGARVFGKSNTVAEGGGIGIVEQRREE
jgi:hypothetical protein